MRLTPACLTCGNPMQLRREVYAHQLFECLTCRPDSIAWMRDGEPADPPTEQP